MDGNPSELNAMTFYVCYVCANEEEDCGTPCFISGRHKRTPQTKQDFNEDLDSLVGMINGDEIYPDTCICDSCEYAPEWELISFEEFIKLLSNEKKLVNVDENGLIKNTNKTKEIADPINSNRFSDLDLV